MHSTEEGAYLKENIILNNNYRIIKIISDSELSIVYLAENLRNKEIQVIKEYFPKSLALRDLDDKVVLHKSPSFKKKFKELRDVFIQEALIMKELNHQNIIGYDDHFEENGTCYIAMEYGEGIRLDEMIKEHHITSLSCFLKNSLLPLLDALDYLHTSGIIHRDIKPSNIMIRKDGQPTILDFGSAIYFKEQNSFTAFTTTGFSPLEFYSNSSEQGVYSDIYSLSATIYYILSGKAPMNISERVIEDKIEPIRNYTQKISPLLSTIIMWGLAMNYKKRCPSLKPIRAAIYMEYIILKIKRA
ncbi:MAG TPA: serine/threonine protein kinase [Bacillus bacterium]|nr:serine/threonine protein kinase [Bacillus sp. (in: firmicutes)]